MINKLLTLLPLKQNQKQILEVSKFDNLPFYPTIHNFPQKVLKDQIVSQNRFSS